MEHKLTIRDPISLLIVMMFKAKKYFKRRNLVLEVLGFNFESLLYVGHGFYGFKMLSVVSGKIKTRKKPTWKVNYSQTLMHFVLRYVRYLIRYLIR